MLEEAILLFILEEFLRRRQMQRGRWRWGPFRQDGRFRDESPRAAGAGCLRRRLLRVSIALVAKLLTSKAARFGFVAFDSPYSVWKALLAGCDTWIQARLSLVAKRGATNLQVKQPVFTFGLLALDLLNLSAPGLAQSSIVSGIFSVPVPQYRGAKSDAGAQLKSDRPSLILPGIERLYKYRGPSPPLINTACDRDVKSRYKIHLESEISILLLSLSPYANTSRINRR
jgi:hypothetical protein